MTAVQLLALASTIPTPLADRMAHALALEAEQMAIRDRNRWPHRWHS